METSQHQTFILKYTPKTLTAIARAASLDNSNLNIQYDVHVTTIEDSSIQKAAKGWRTVTQEEGDLFIVEVDPGVPSSQFELPFSQVDFFADEQQKRISQRDPSMKL
jgi:hypothetical protein